MKQTEDEVWGVASDVFSSGFDSSSEVKPLLEELSVLDDPVSNTMPLLVPNLNPEAVAGGSDFLSSLEAAPNLKPSDELLNLKPDEAVVPFEVDSDEELPNGTPNLNPLEDDEEEDDSANDPPNLKPPDPDPEVLSDVPNLNPPDPDPVVLSDVPNLKPPEVEEEELSVEEPDVPPADEPKDEPKAKEKTEINNKKCNMVKVDSVQVF